MLSMKKFVKPELNVLEIRLEERIAACDSVELDNGAWVLNGTSPNRNRPLGDPQCYKWVSDISYSANES